MPDRREVLGVALRRLAACLPRSIRHEAFRLSFEGFWRSFFAAVLVAPGFALLVAQKLVARPGPRTGWATLAGARLRAGLGRVPAGGGGADPAVRAEPQLRALIVALNWASVLQVGAFLAAVAIGMAAPEVFDGLLPLLVTGAILFYQWFVTRAALESTGGVALLLVLVDLILNGAISLSADRLSWVSGPILDPDRQARGRRRRPGRRPIPRRQHCLDMRDRPAALADHLQRADDVAHLVVQERARPGAISISSPVARHGAGRASSPGDVAWHSLRAGSW